MNDNRSNSDYPSDPQLPNEASAQSFPSSDQDAAALRSSAYDAGSHEQLAQTPAEIPNQGSSALSYPDGSTAWDQWNAPYQNLELKQLREQQSYTQSSERATFSGSNFGAFPAAPTAQQPGSFSGTETPSAVKSEGTKGHEAGKVVGVLLAAALVGALAGFGGSMAATSLNQGASSANVSASEGTNSLVINNPDSINGTTAVASKVLPSVVTIAASSESAAGSGSGVVLSEDGYVVTNTHVVTLGGATGTPDLQVSTASGEVYDATIVGLDPIYDLAVIKLAGASGLTPIEFADSAALNVGDSTMAVGAPLGLANTVTTGIVSALDRSISIASAAVPESAIEQVPPGDDERGGGLPDFFFDFGDQFGQQQQQQSQTSSSISIAVVQTDAAINPGNSGGALVDAQGRLIGINVAIATAGGTSSESGAGSIGVGFAIPSNVVKWVSDELIASGAAVHGLLGATVTDAAAGDNDILGAEIVELSSGGAAQVAGLRAGDIVIGVNDSSVTNATDLTAQIRALPGGSEAEISYVRDSDKVQTVSVTLGNLE